MNQTSGGGEPIPFPLLQDADRVTYQLGEGDPHSITCLVCGFTSYLEGDVKHGYCGHCHRFHRLRDQVVTEVPPWAAFNPYALVLDHLEDVCQEIACMRTDQGHHRHRFQLRRLETDLRLIMARLGGMVQL